MGIADDMRKLSESSGSDDKEVRFRIEQLHKMIKDEAKRGNLKLRVSANFFRGDEGLLVREQLETDGFQIWPPTFSDFINGHTTSVDPSKGNWTIYWHKQEDDE